MLDVAAVQENRAALKKEKIDQRDHPGE